MPRKLNALEVVGERTVRRLAKSGKVERWLIVDTSIEDSDPKMGQLTAAAQNLLRHGDEFDGVEIWSLDNK
jgi:hypothetical protein